MRAATVIARVFTQLKKFFDIEVPRFQVSAYRTLALAALIYSHCRIVHHFQERHHALRFAVGAFDVRAECAHWRPVVTETTGKLGEQGVFFQRLVDTIEVIGYRGEVAAGELRATCTGIE